MHRLVFYGSIVAVVMGLLASEIFVVALPKNQEAIGGEITGAQKKAIEIWLSQSREFRNYSLGLIGVAAFSVINTVRKTGNTQTLSATLYFWSFLFNVASIFCAHAMTSHLYQMLANDILDMFSPSLIIYSKGQYFCFLIGIVGLVVALYEERVHKN